jgi:hypothetical protein
MHCCIPHIGPVIPASGEPLLLPLPEPLLLVLPPSVLEPLLLVLPLPLDPLLLVLPLLLPELEPLLLVLPLPLPELEPLLLVLPLLLLDPLLLVLPLLVPDPLLLVLPPPSSPLTVVDESPPHANAVAIDAPRDAIKRILSVFMQVLQVTRNNFGLLVVRCAREGSPHRHVSCIWCESWPQQRSRSGEDRDKESRFCPTTGRAINDSTARRSRHAILGALAPRRGAPIGIRWVNRADRRGQRRAGSVLVGY